MATFRILGVTAQGTLVARELAAASREEANGMAQTSGLRVVDVQARGDGILRGQAVQRQRTPRFDLALFVNELLVLREAGLSLIEILEALIERQVAAQRAESVLEDLVRRLREGQRFSTALEAHTAIFPPLLVASIAASEHTGELAPALRRFLRYHEQLGSVRQKVISASLYPALLCAVGCAVTLFLLFVLVPKFSRAYEGMHAQLPWASRWLMHWGRFVSEHWQGLCLTMISAVLVMGFLATQATVRARVLRAIQRNRWIGGLLRLVQLSRFYRSVSMLLDGGVPLLQSLEMTQGLLPQGLQVALQATMREVSHGRRLSESLQMASLTTPVSLRLLRVGERNGRMAAMLEQAASFHEQEAGHWIDRFTRLFEPVVMLAIGLVIGGIVILLYLPIFELAGGVL